MFSIFIIFTETSILCISISDVATKKPPVAAAWPAKYEKLGWLVVEPYLPLVGNILLMMMVNTNGYYMVNDG